MWFFSLGKDFKEILFLPLLYFIVWVKSIDFSADYAWQEYFS